MMKAGTEDEDEDEEEGNTLEENLIIGSIEVFYCLRHDDRLIE